MRLAQISRLLPALLGIVVGDASICSLTVGAEQPNIVLIMADDVSPDMFGCYGSTDAKTPNLDRMAKHPGVTADHPYFEHPKAARWLKAHQSPSAREKHLHNHSDYQFYDETLPREQDVNYNAQRIGC